MSRLPPALQPAWPLVKRLHRSATRHLGTATRAAAKRFPHDGAVPLRGTDSSRATAALEPDAVTWHYAGPAETLRRPIPQGDPSGHWVFDYRAHYQAPERFVLEINEGTIVGDYAAHITPGGVLDYETSTYFGISGWREHPIYLRPRLPRVERINGSLVSLATRGSSANYYHFLLDVLPRWGVFEDALPGTTPDHFFLNRSRGYQEQLLALIGLGDVPAIEPTKHISVSPQVLYVPSIPNPDLMAPRWTTTWLKERLPAKDTASRPKRLYITRGSAKNTRRLVNEAAVMEILRPLGFAMFDPGEHDVQDQIDHFAAAEVIVAPHGAALSNLTFCNPGVRVLELFAPRYVNPCYWTIADNVSDSVYRYLVCGEDSRGPGAPMDGVLTDITVDLTAFRYQLEALLEA